MQPKRQDSGDVRPQDLVVFTLCYGFQFPVSLQFCFVFFFLLLWGKLEECFVIQSFLAVRNRNSY